MGAMPEVECGDVDEPAGGRICRHLFAARGCSTSIDYYRHFTGIGADYILICADCRQSGVEVPLHWVCSDCLEDASFGNRLGEEGRPEIRDREIGFTVEHTSLELVQGKLLQAASLNTSEWVAIDEDGDLLRIDSRQGKVRREFSLRRMGQTFWKRLLEVLRTATLSPSHIVLAAEPLVLIAAAFDTYGAVFDLRTGKVTMKLRRGSYRVEDCRFPAAFFESAGRLLLVHATDWNRLDISDPFTGECLTARELPVALVGSEGPQRYLNYFHGGLHVSPSGKWIASNGWVWHPAGIVRSWNLSRWLTTNLWEPEDGESRRSLCHRDYFWDGAVCWVDDTTLAVWGLGNDDNVMVHGVRLFDVTSGEELRSFAGPQTTGKSGIFIFDEFLFSYGKGCEFGVWDVASGERVFRSDSFVPLAYNSKTRTFLHQDQSGRLHLARIAWHVRS